MKTWFQVVYDFFSGNLLFLFLYPYSLYLLDNLLTLISRTSFELKRVYFDTDSDIPKINRKYLILFHTIYIPFIIISIYLMSKKFPFWDIIGFTLIWSYIEPARELMVGPTYHYHSANGKVFYIKGERENGIMYIKESFGWWIIIFPISILHLLISLWVRATEFWGGGWKKCHPNI